MTQFPLTSRFVCFIPNRARSEITSSCSGTAAALLAMATRFKAIDSSGFVSRMGDSRPPIAGGLFEGVDPTLREASRPLVVVEELRELKAGRRFQFPNHNDARTSRGNL